MTDFDLTHAIVWHCTISVDGYCADTAHDVAPLLRSEQSPNPLVDRILPRIGAILVGRRSWDLASGQEGGEAYGGAVKVPEFVVTRRPMDGDGRREVLDGTDLGAVAARAREEAKGGCAIVIGPTLARAMLEEGHIDLIVVHVAPILLGAGDLFCHTLGRAPLRLLHCSQAGQTVNLVYAPDGRAT